MERSKHVALDEVWPSGRPPPAFTREDRVALLAEAFQALLAGRLPSRAAALFVGGAGLAWLSQGGSLERDFLKVTAKAGSHHTPTYVWQTLCDEVSSEGAQPGDGEDTLSGTSTEGEL